jgi:hypothetical protein
MAGATLSQCGGCGLTFVSVEAFEAHRSGSHIQRSRRCLTPQEMRAKGMAYNECGAWRMPVRVGIYVEVTDGEKRC